MSNDVKSPPGPCGVKIPGNMGEHFSEQLWDVGTAHKPPKETLSGGVWGGREQRNMGMGI